MEKIRREYNWKKIAGAYEALFVKVLNERK